MGHKHTKEEILAGALETAISDGLSQLTFGRVAKHLGINDRIVVYYFPTKDDLITNVLLAMGGDLQAALGQAFTGPAGGHLALTRAAWPILTSPESDQVFALFFEANGLAAAGREPYRSLVTGIIAAWVEWLVGFFEGTDSERRTEAEAAIALIDGLLLLRHLAGPESADRAASRLGVI